MYVSERKESLGIAPLIIASAAEEAAKKGGVVANIVGKITSLFKKNNKGTYDWTGANAAKAEVMNDPLYQYYSAQGRIPDSAMADLGPANTSEWPARIEAVKAAITRAVAEDEAGTYTGNVNLVGMTKGAIQALPVYQKYVASGQLNPAGIGDGNIYLNAPEWAYRVNDVNQKLNALINADGTAARIAADAAAAYAARTLAALPPALPAITIPLGPVTPQAPATQPDWLTALLAKVVPAQPGTATQAISTGGSITSPLNPEAPATASLIPPEVVKVLPYVAGLVMFGLIFSSLRRPAYYGPAPLERR